MLTKLRQFQSLCWIIGSTWFISKFSQLLPLSNYASDLQPNYQIISSSAQDLLGLFPSCYQFIYLAFRSCLTWCQIMFLRLRNILLPNTIIQSPKHSWVVTINVIIFQYVTWFVSSKPTTINVFPWPLAYLEGQCHSVNIPAILELLPSLCVKTLT